MSSLGELRVRKLALLECSHFLMSFLLFFPFERLMDFLSSSVVSAQSSLFSCENLHHTPAQHQNCF